MWVTPKTLTQRQDKKKIGNEEAGEVIQRTPGTLKWKREWTRKLYAGFRKRKGRKI